MRRDQLASALDLRRCADEFRKTFQKGLSGFSGEPYGRRLS
jgi:hypothetical protein